MQGLQKLLEDKVHYNNYKIQKDYMNDKGFFDNDILPVVEDPELGEIKQKLSELGIDMFPCFDNDNSDKDTEIARDCIYNGKDAPDDVRNRLLERKEHLKVPKTRLLYKRWRILSR